MIDIAKNGTKIDLELAFAQLRLKVNFECSVSIYVLTNTNKVESEDTSFDAINTKCVGDIKKIVKTSMVLYPNKRNSIEINILLLTKKGKKCAGVLHFDIDDALKNSKNNFILPLEKCPDPQAKLSFNFKFSNPKPLEIIDNPFERKKAGLNTTNISFYSHLNNEDTSFNKNTAQDISNVSLNIRSLTRNRSKSPGGNIRLNFNSQRVKPVSRQEFTPPAKEFPIDSPRKETKPNIFDNYYKENVVQEKKEIKSADNSKNHIEQNQEKNDDKKFKDVEDNFCSVNKENIQLRYLNEKLKSELNMMKSKFGNQNYSSVDNKLITEIDDLKKIISSKDEAIMSLKYEFKQAEAKFIEFKSQSDKRFVEIQKSEKYVQRKNDELEEENFMLDEKYSDVKQKLYELETQLEQLKEDRSIHLDNEKNWNMNESFTMKYLEEENYKLSTKLKTVEYKNNELIKRLDTIKEEKNEHDDSMFKESNRISELEKELDKAKEQLSNKELESLNLKRENLEYKVKYERDMAENLKEKQLLKKQINQAQETQSQSQILDLKTKLDEKEETIFKLENELELLEETLNNPINCKTDDKKTIYKLEKQLEETLSELEKYKSTNENTNEKYKSQFELFLTKIKELESQNKELDTINKNLKLSDKEYANIKEENNKKDKIIKELYDKIENNIIPNYNNDNENLINYRNQIYELKEDNKKLRNELQLKNLEMDSFKEEINKLKILDAEKNVVDSKNTNFASKKLILDNECLDENKNSYSNENLLRQAEAHKERIRELEALVSELKQQIESVKCKTSYDMDDIAIVTVENENLKRKIKLMEMRISDNYNKQELENKLKQKEDEADKKYRKLEKENMDLQRRLEKLSKDNIKFQGVDRSEYIKLEKTYVDSMKKIGDVLMMVQSLKLKKTDKDKIIGTLVN